MSDGQRWAASVIFTMILLIAWLVLVFMAALGDIESVNAELQGLAIAAVTMLLGISTGAASKMTSKMKGLRVTRTEKK